VNFDQVNKWLTLIANFGVIGGLVLVAMQMNLATQAINHQSDIELSGSIAAGELAFMGESTATAWAVAVLNPAELDEVQVAQLWAYLNNALLSVQQTWLSNRKGMASDATWARARVMGAANLNFGAGRIWWQEAKWFYAPDFVEEIDSELVKMSSSAPLVENVKKMLEEIHQLEQEPAMTPKS